MGGRRDLIRVAVGSIVICFGGGCAAALASKPEVGGVVLGMGADCGGESELVDSASVPAFLSAVSICFSACDSSSSESTSISIHLFATLTSIIKSRKMTSNPRIPKHIAKTA